MIDIKMQSDQINELSTALAKAQKHIGVAVYDKQNPHFRSKYASYAAIRKACEEVLSDNGLSISHILMPHGEKRSMVTQLMHSSGQWLRSLLIMPQDKETPQGVGSSISYAMRYSLSALLAIPAGEDDDGEEAEKPYRAPVYLSEDQINQVEELIDGDDVLRVRILSGYKVDSLAKIDAKNFEPMMKNLMNRKKS